MVSAICGMLQSGCYIIHFRWEFIGFQNREKSGVIFLYQKSECPVFFANGLAMLPHVSFF